MNSDIPSDNNYSSLQLSLTKSFEVEAMCRTIDSATDLESLKALTKQLLRAWAVSSEMLKFEMGKGLPSISKVNIQKNQ